MEEMHYFKESQREEIPVPDFKDNITRKLLLQFLCDLCTWAQATPVTSVGIKKDAHSLYILFRNFAFSEQDFWQTFGGYLIALRPKWKIGIFGTENCEYPGNWAGEIEKKYVFDDTIITATHVYSKDSSLSFHVVSFIKVKDDKIISVDEYWGDDGVAPQWRLDKHIGTVIK